MQQNWAPGPRAEGSALSPDHTVVYTGDLFTSQVYRIPLADPYRLTVVGRPTGPGAIEFLGPPVSESDRYRPS